MSRTGRELVALLLDSPSTADGASRMVAEAYVREAAYAILRLETDLEQAMEDQRQLAAALARVFKNPDNLFRYIEASLSSPRSES